MSTLDSNTIAISLMVFNLTKYPSTQTSFERDSNELLTLNEMNCSDVVYLLTFQHKVPSSGCLYAVNAEWNLFKAKAVGES